MMEGTLSAMENLRLDEPISDSTEAFDSLDIADANNAEVSQKPPEEAARQLFDLPAELLNQIVDHCEYEPPFEVPITMEHYPTNRESSILKTLRSVNKVFSELVTPSLFKTITLYQHAVYWENLANIANTPSLAVCVEHIRLAHIGYVGQIAEFDLWEAMTDRRRGVRGDFVEHPPAGGPLAKWDFSAEAGWERYQRWRDAELIMREHDEAKNAPQVALDLLTNLKSIETIGIAPLWAIRRRSWMRSHGVWHGRPETRRYFETGLFCENTTVGGPLGDHPYVPSTHLRTMMVALRACGANVTKLTVHRVQELYHIDEPGLGLPSLKHLVVDTSSVRYQDWLEVKDAKATSWINNLENLERLDICQNLGGMNNPDFCHALSLAEWPKLRRMELADLETSNHNLRYFVARHIHKLEYLKIQEPIMDQKDSQDFSRGFADWVWAYPEKQLQLLEREYIQPEPVARTSEDGW